MKKNVKKYLKHYQLDLTNGIYYSNTEHYKHFLKIIEKYPYWDIAKEYLTVYLEPSNNMHTSYFDNEQQAIHLLYKHIEKYTVIHELTHFIQYLVGLDENYTIDKIIGYDDIMKKYAELNDIEPYTTFLDIINSASMGEMTKYMGGTHTIKYFNDDPDLAIQEIHSDYCSLLFNGEDKLIKKIPTDILNIAKTYHNLVNEKLQEILDKKENI